MVRRFFPLTWSPRRGNDDTTGIVRHHWDRRAPTFDDQAGHGLVSDEQRRAWLHLLSRFTGRSPEQVLDIGCGTGFLALRFAELGHIVTGVDLSSQMLDRARHKADEAGLTIDLRIGDASALDSANETYDIVAARHVVWNLPDPERGVAEWLRVLRPGGQLILIEGKWADDECAATNGGHKAQFVESLKDAVVEVSRRTGIGTQRFRRRRYRRVEVGLPFSGGPSPDRLKGLLEGLSVVDIEVVPLMDAALWGEAPPFPRYLVRGSRPD